MRAACAVSMRGHRKYHLSVSLAFESETKMTKYGLPGELNLLVYAIYFVFVMLPIMVNSLFPA